MRRLPPESIGSRLNPSSLVVDAASDQPDSDRSHPHSQQSIVPVRDRSEVTASNLKKPEMLPPSEVRQAITYLIEEQIGLRREELPVMVSRVFGFKSTSAKAKELVEKTLLSMHEAGDVVSRDDKLFLA
jgi:hypothetical protein